MLLEIAGYGLFGNGDWLSIAAATFMRGFGAFALGILLALLILIPAFVSIVAVSVYRGAIHRSVPKTIGSFFRLSGILLGILFMLLLLPTVIFFKLNLLAFAIISIGFVVIGYFFGRTVSKWIGFRLQFIARKIKWVDLLLSKISRLVNFI